jgi:glucose/arabinose dehydrogenase
MVGHDVVRSCGHWLVAVLYVVTLVGCGKSPDEGSQDSVSGTERIGWNQSAADPADLPSFRYVIYVDGGRSDLAGVSCVPAGARQLSCSAPLPTMSPGSHTIELATVARDGAESERTAPAQVNVGASGSSSTAPVSIQTVVSANKDAKSASEPAAWSAQVLTKDGVRLQLERISDQVVEPIDMAFTPDGRLLVAEREGRVLLATEGRLIPQPALFKEEGLEQLHAIAVDPQFERTHFVYAVFTNSVRSGVRAFGIARFRELSNTLAERVIVRDQIARASSTPSASMRVAADGKLFVAFDDADTSSLADDLSSANGKLLRMNPDGTTPDDQAGGSPLYASAYRSPRGLDWYPAAPMLWIADRDRPESSRLSVVAMSEGRQKRGLPRTSYRLPRDSPVSSVAFYRIATSSALRNNLLVASEEGRHLLRVLLDPQEPSRIVATERLLQDMIGGVRTVAVGPDGAIYLGTANAIGRLVPQ